MNRLLAALALVFVVSSSPTFAGPGRVIGWGNNELGQATFWNDPPFGATAIAAGGAGGLALMSNSTVIGWGDTTYSQDKPPLFLTNVIAVSMGTYHGLALVSNGTVVAWGNGGDGRTSPPGGLTNVIRIAAGGEHCLALRNDGVIVGWGKNNNGQASPPGFTNFTEIAAGDKFSVGLRSDGSLVAWGDNSNGQTVPSPSITGVVKIAAGERHGLALLGNGLVAGWGDNSGSQALPPGSLSNVVAIAAGGKHSLALRNDGRVVAWGDNSLGQATVPGGLSNVVAIAAGDSDSYALKNDGAIIRWGRASLLVKYPPGGIDDAVAIAGGGTHSLALRSNGYVVAWGDNEKGQCTIPSILSNVTDIAAGTAHSIALAGGGGVVAWGDNSQGQSTVPGGLTGIVDVAAGSFFSLALRPDGTIAHWGDNIAFPSPSITGVVAIAAGGYHGVALQAGGTVVAWGDNSQGQSTVPGGLTGVVGIAAGEYFSLARLNNGSVVAWGNTNFGLASPPVLSSVIDLAAGRLHAMALKADGGAATWGDNLYQQIPVPPGLPPALQLEAGAVHSLGIFMIPPSIVSQPSNVATLVGFISPFAVTASGSAPLEYQWRFNNTIIPGATQNTYVISNTQPTNAGSYDVIVSNAAGSVTSVAAGLVVQIPPSIVTNPSNTTVLAGNPAGFVVGAAGSSPLSFQWRKGGSIIGGATSSNLLFGTTSTNDQASYDVIVSNIYGSVTSAPATLTVLVSPTISSNPSARTVVAGSGTSFGVAAGGTAPLFFQWRQNGAAIGSATNPTYAIGTVTTNDAGSYDVIVSNVAGSITSALAALTVLVPPTISSNPTSQSVFLGNATAFGVAASGTAPLYFQWRHNGSVMGSATNSAFGIGLVATNDAGTYDVIVSNSAGSITSAAATLTVLVPPSISVHPVDVTVPTGGVANFFVTASGSAPLYYQWTHASPISGATASNYTIGSVTLADAGSYFVVVSNSAGVSVSSTAILTIAYAPSIYQPPAGLTVGVGSNFSLTVIATGTAPLAYKWRRNGVVLAGATDTTYAVAGAALADAGDYDVVVTNTAGSVTSITATVTILGAPQVTASPGSRTVWAGMDVTFNAAVIGTAPLSRQWQRNSTDIPNATNATLVLTGVTTSQIGRYRVIVSNPYGAATSAPATLIVRSGAAVGLRNDFDGDGKTDLALTGPVSSRWVRTVFIRGQWRTFTPKRHPISSAWFIMQSTAGYRSQEFGWTTDRAIPGDYDGDNRTDLAIYRPDSATWYIIDSSIGAIRSEAFGRAGAIPLSGDFDGDGVTDLAFYDRNTGDWVVQRSSDGAVRTQNWGWADALPVPGDFDGDSVTDLAVYDTTAGDWYVLRSSDGQIHRQNWGWSGADPAPGDYDGDGRTDLTAYDPVSAVWYVQRSGTGNMWRQPWGVVGGVAVPGDYDGDTITDIAVYDPVLSQWSVLKSTDGGILGGAPLQFGSPDTKPASTQPPP